MTPDINRNGDESFSSHPKSNPHQKVIGSYISKILRDHFGKGPESVSVSAGGHCLTVHLRNFLTNSERRLLQEDHQIIIYQMREKLMQIMIPEIAAYLEQLTGARPEEFYYDWDLQSMSGVIAAFFPEPLPDSPPVLFEYEGKGEIEHEIVRISKQGEKAPEEIRSFEINPRTIVIVRKGIFIRIEKEFIRLGHGELLKVVKRSLERDYLRSLRVIRAVPGRKVHQFYIDYNYEQDKSVILLVW